jgi:GTP-binding protein
MKLWRLLFYNIFDTKAYLIYYKYMSSHNMYEPFETVEITVPQVYQGVVMQQLGTRSADIQHIEPNEAGTEFTFFAKMPTRALLGLKSILITSTKGSVVMNNVFEGYKPMVNFVPATTHGSIISTETDESSGYSLANIQQRGALFIGSAVPVYQGMVIGQCAKDQDLEVNPCKDKKMSNVRSKSSDDAINLTTPQEMTLEKSLEYISSSATGFNEEILEITPKSLRIRKKHLDPNERRRASR